MDLHIDSLSDALSDDAVVLEDRRASLQRCCGFARYTRLELHANFADAEAPRNRDEAGQPRRHD